VQKHLFNTPKLDLDIGQSIRATVGYETYGQLSPARDNAILICHYFSGTSHAAGRYHPDDAEPGWWDALVGPGKAFDTNRYFVIAIDTLCNLNVRNPLVITTGPATVDLATGLPYGDQFPQVTIRDNVRLQHQLLASLGIESLVAVAGPSMGGFQALEWAVTYPHMVGKAIAAVSAPICPPVFALAYCQACMDAIVADPVNGLVRAARLMTTLARSDTWITGIWGRKTAAGSAHPWADREGRFAFQSEMETVARQRAQLFDANHFIYTARACILHDIGYGNRGIEVAAQKIQAAVLMLPVTSDLIFAPEASQSFVELIKSHGGLAEVFPIASPNGHLAAITEAGRLAEPIARFLSRGELH
jgi:homoserine O-acetyltransferase